MVNVERIQVGRGLSLSREMMEMPRGMRPIFQVLFIIKKGILSGGGNAIEGWLTGREILLFADSAKVPVVVTNKKVYDAVRASLYPGEGEPALWDKLEKEGKIALVK